MSSSHDSEWIDHGRARSMRASMAWIGEREKDSRPEVVGSRWASVLGVLVIGIASLALAGWIAGNETLKSIVPGMVAMKVNTACGLIAAALSLILQSTPRASPRRLAIARMFAVIPLAIGLLTLFQHLVGADLGIDRLLMKATAQGEARMTFATATCFCLASGPLLSLDAASKRAPVVVRTLACLVLGIALVTGIGYVYRTIDLYAPGPYRPMGLHTSIAFVALSGGILVSRDLLALKLARGWRVRTKLVVLLLAISLVPFTLFALLELRAGATQLLQAEEATLTARSEQIAADIDRFNEQNGELAELIARRAVANRCCGSLDPEQARTLRASLVSETDRSHTLRAMALLDAAGIVRVASPPTLEGRDLSGAASVRAALRGTSTSPEVRKERFDGREEASILYVARIRPEAGQGGVAAVWTNAASLSRFLARSTTDSARGFAVVVGHDGARIANTSNAEVALEPSMLAAAERGLIRAFTPATRDYHYAVGQRLESAPWTVLYLVSEAALRARLAPHTVNTVLIAFLLSGIATLFGVYLTNGILKPLGALSNATEKLARGQLSARVEVTRGDELGLLAGDFNTMAGRIESQAAALQRANQDLELRVQQRTAALTASESSLRASESRYRELFEHHPDMCATIDTETEVIRACNQQMLTQLGYTQDEIIGKPILELYAPEFTANREAYREALMMSGHVHDTERVLVRKDGSLIETSLSVSVVEDDSNGQIATAVWRDISDRKRAERDEQFMITRRSEERFRILVEGVRDYAIFLLDTQGFIKSWNRGAERIKGYTESEIIGKHLSIFYTDEDKQRGHVAEALHIAEREGKFSEEGWRVRKDGTRLWASVVITPLYDSQGNLEAFAKVTRDESERRRTDEALRQRQDELTASLREREILLQEVHHRVKNNLQVVSSLLNMQMRQSTDEEARSALAESRQRVAAIALIHEKLYQSKDYAGVPFSDYVRTLAADVFHAAGSAFGRVELEIDVEPISLAVDKAIPCGLILSELLSNALKHAFPKDREGTVRVSLNPVGRDMLLTVADDGVGIPADFSVDTAETLGMQLVTTLVEQLDGKLEILSEGGSTFKVRFPCEELS